MKLIKQDNEYHLLADYNKSEDYDSRITTGTLFWKDEFKDVCVAEYSPASRVSRPLIASTDVAYKNKIALLDKNQIERLIGKPNIGIFADKYFEDKFDKSEGFDLKHGWRKIFIEAYEQALSDNVDKKYTQQDMEKSFSKGISFGLASKHNQDVEPYKFSSFIASLNKTEWNIESEMDEKCKGICYKIAHDHSDDAECCTGVCEESEKPKITNGYVNILSIK